MSNCPGPNCKNTCAPGKLLCFAHWKRVPFTLQMRVQRAWRNLQLAKKPNMWRACAKAYREARAEAIASLSAKESA